MSRLVDLRLIDRRRDCGDICGLKGPVVVDGRPRRPADH
jgi:hypothetical protein